jgi:predicted TPR repeat methyltransferase
VFYRKITTDWEDIMVRKTIGAKAVRSTAKAKTAPPRAAKATAKSGSGLGKATKSQANARPLLDPAQAAAMAKSLSALHISLKAAAKTPDQQADVGIVGLAQKHAEQGDHPTVGSLLQRLSNWARDHQTQIRDHIAHAVIQAVTRG